MDAFLLPDGNMRVPVSFGDDKVYGLMFGIVTPESPLFKAWTEYYEKIGKKIPRSKEKPRKEPSPEKKEKALSWRRQGHQRDGYEWWAKCPEVGLEYLIVEEVPNQKYTLTDLDDIEVGGYRANAGNYGNRQISHGTFSSLVRAQQEAELLCQREIAKKSLQWRHSPREQALVQTYPENLERWESNDGGYIVKKTSKGEFVLISRTLPASDRPTFKTSKEAMYAAEQHAQKSLDWIGQQRTKALNWYDNGHWLQSDDGTWYFFIDEISNGQYRLEMNRHFDMQGTGIDLGVFGSLDQAKRRAEDQSEREHRKKFIGGRFRLGKALIIPNVKAGFTGTRRDRSGREMCYHQGVHVPCEQVAATQQKQRGQQEQAVSKQRIQQKEERQNTAKREDSVRNREKQDEMDKVTHETDEKIRLHKETQKEDDTDTKEGVKRFLDQKYSDNDGEWKVSDIFQYMEDNKVPVTKISVEELSDSNLMPEFADADEKIGSPEFVERAKKSDLSYPILIVEYPDELWVCDGLHRLWKAREEGLETIDARVISKEQLDSIKKSFAPTSLSAKDKIEEIKQRIWTEKYEMDQLSKPTTIPPKVKPSPFKKS